MCWRARQLRGRGGHSALLSLKVGGSSLRHCLHKNYYLGGRWGGGMSLVLLCWCFNCAFGCCILCCWFAVDCQRNTHFIFCFCGEILKSGLLRLTTWCDILSCSHDLDFLVSGHHRFDDLIDKEVDFIENCRKCLGQAETEKQNIENTHTITVEDKDCSCNCEQEFRG